MLVLQSHSMPSPADFSDLFDPCRTHRAADDAYREGIYVLQEALRLAHVRIVTVRDAPTATVTKRTAQDESERALRAIQRSKDTAIRNWATQEGVVFKNVSKKIRALYEEAHPE